MSDLPFSSDKPLFESIKKKYLLDALKWLCDFHDPSSKTFLGTKMGSTWGVGYTLICLIESREIYLESKQFIRGFDEKARASVEYLIEQASFGQGICNWEANIWDTAVITRAILLYSLIYPDTARSLSTTKKILEDSIRWLCIQVISWHNLRYTLGIAELSQVLRTIISFKKIYPDTFDAIRKDIAESMDQSDVIRFMIEEMVHSAAPQTIDVDGKNEDVVVWDDGVFGTAETIISLSKYVEYLDSLEIKGDCEEEKKQLLDFMGPALRYIELQQKDGRWGIEEETAIALRAYIAGYRVWGKRIGPEPHIVFKALRYLCDTKTVFADGSIAHEMEPTIYFAMALIETLKNWKLPDSLCQERSTIQLYDYIVWNTPSRTTYERLLRTKAETEASVLRSVNDRLTNRLVQIGKQLGFWQALAYLTIWLIVLGFLLSFSNTINTTTISVPIGFEVTDWEVFLALLGSWATVGFALYNFIFKRLYKRNNMG